MEKIAFTVQGSAAEPYEVTFTMYSPGKISAHCTCVAGEKGSVCKHRTRILKGQSVGIVSKNVADVHRVQDWYKGSELEKALMEVEECEEELARAEAAVGIAKKKLQHAMFAGA